MKELVTYIVKSLVEFPDQVSIQEVEGEKGTLFELRVADSDIGKVIGKHGRTINSIRSILAAASARKGEYYNLVVVEK